MINLMIRFYGMHPHENFKELLNDNREMQMNFKKSLTVKELLEMLLVEPNGKLVSINKSVELDHSKMLIDGDVIEIRKLYAGG